MFSFLKNRKEKIAAGKAIDTAEAIIDCFSTILSLSSDQKSMLKEFTYPFMKKVYVTQSLAIKDIDIYIDFIYLSGYINPSFSQFKKHGMSTILKRRIFVPVDVMAQFDDWDGFRQSALCDGLMLTSDASAPTIADWNKELSLFLYPLFDSSNSTPAKDILERIVQITNEARYEASSIPEYIALLADLDYKRELPYLSKLDAKIEELLCNYVRDLEIIPEQPPSDLVGTLKRKSGHINRWDFVRRLRIQHLIDEEIEFQKQFFRQAIKDHQ